MDKVSFWRTGLRLFMGGMGRAILEKILGNTKYKSFRKDTEMVWCVVSDYGRDVTFTRRSLLSAVNQS